MFKDHGVFILIVLLVAGSCINIVSATDSLAVVGTNLAGKGSTGNVQVIMNYDKNGLSGYNITLSLANTSVASISAACPSWSTSGYCTITQGTGKVTVKLADVADKVTSPVAGYNLLTAAVTGTQPGCTYVNAVINAMDDNFGTAMTPSVSRGYISVGGSPGTIIVNSSPTGAWIYIDNKNTSVRTNASISAVGGAAIQPGTHTVTVSIANYDNKTMQVIVPCGGRVTADFGALVRLGMFTISSNPSGAEIYLELDPQTDTKKQTSSTLTLGYGSHWFTVKKSGYQDASVQKTVSAAPGSYTFTLVSVANNPPPYGSLHIDSQPQGAEIFVDGQDQSLQTPAEFGVLTGTHDVNVTLAGYRTPDTQTVTVAGDQTLYLSFALETASAVSARVKILPDPLNIGRKGKFIAFILLPDKYNAADVKAASVACEGAKALRVIRFRPFPHLLIAIFSRNNPNIGTGDNVRIDVSGLITSKGKTVKFTGYDTVTVISRKDTSRDTTDDLDRMNDDQIYRNFYPGAI